MINIEKELNHFYLDKYSHITKLSVVLNLEKEALYFVKVNKCGNFGMTRNCRVSLYYNSVKTLKHHNVRSLE